MVKEDSRARRGRRGTVSGRLEVERDFAHTRTARLETDTPGFTLVNAGVDWQPLKDRPDLTLALSFNNNFDVEARRSTSLLKGYAPLAGRDLRLTARLHTEAPRPRKVRRCARQPIR